MIIIISKSAFIFFIILIMSSNPILATISYILLCIFVIIRGSLIFYLTHKIISNKNKYRKEILHIKQNIELVVLHTILFTILNCLIVIFELTLPFLSAIICLCGIFEIAILKNLSLELED